MECHKQEFVGLISTLLTKFLIFVRKTLSLSACLLVFFSYWVFGCGEGGKIKRSITLPGHQSLEEATSFRSFLMC